MDNKLSELSKPVGFVSKQAQALLKSGDTASVRPFFDVQGSSPLYSQEYVSALLAELEAKDTPKDIRVAEIEKRLKQRAEEMERILEGITPEMIAGGWTAKGISDYAKLLEAKLATPVRLPALLQPERDAVNGMIFANGRNEAIAECSVAIRQAGFLSEASPMTVEGDE
ncbi:MAG: hypothetical protein ACTH4K_16820 [Serratia bockelmannii]